MHRFLHKCVALISTTHTFVTSNLFPALHFRTMKINLTVTQVREIHECNMMQGWPVHVLCLYELLFITACVCNHGTYFWWDSNVGLFALFLLLTDLLMKWADIKTWSDWQLSLWGYLCAHWFEINVLPGLHVWGFEVTWHQQCTLYQIEY